MNPVGYIEFVSADEVRGWVFDPVNPDSSLHIQCFIKKQFITTIEAGLFRDDLLAAGIGNGRHAFTWERAPGHASFQLNDLLIKVGDWDIPVAVSISQTQQIEILAPDQSQKSEELGGDVLLLDNEKVGAIRASALFDMEFVFSQLRSEISREDFNKNPELYFIGRKPFAINPNPLFITDWYLKEHARHLSRDEHPFVHYVTKGIELGLMPNFCFKPDWYLRYIDESQIKLAQKNPLKHYIEVGSKSGISTHPLFYPHWYYDKHADIKKAGVDALAHYIRVGHKEHRHVHPLIDTRFYAARYETRAPVVHEIWRRGMAQGTILHPIMDLQASNKDRVEEYNLPAEKSRQQAWLSFNKQNNKRALETRRAMNEVTERILLSIVMPVFNPPIDIFRDAVHSVLDQSYSEFEFIIIDDASTNEAVKNEISYFQSVDQRVKTIFHAENMHISKSTNDGVEIASGSYVVFLDHDDSLLPDALAQLVIYADKTSMPEVLYSDDCRTDLSGDEIEGIRFKPAWSPELLLSYSYPSHLRAVRTDVYRKIGGSRIGLEGSQDHDMFLRLSELDVRFEHIPLVLYGRRALPGSTALGGDEKPYSFDAGIRAVKEAFQRRGLAADVVRPEWAIRSGLGIFRPVMPHFGPKVTIIIPTKDNARKLIRLMRSLALTQYENYDVLIIDNQSEEAETKRYLADCPYRVHTIRSKDNKFNFSYLNNEAVKLIDSELVLFLNDDTEVLSPDWLSQMVGWLRLPGVGVVGARLLFSDRRVQHGGVSPEQTSGYTMFRGLPASDHGYLSAAVVTRNCAAVTAACLLTRRDLFSKLSGFDERSFGVAFNDVDFCLRVREQGLRIVYCAEAELFHHEGSSRPKRDNPSEISAFKAKYKNYHDPYMNVNLDRESSRMDIGAIVVPPVKVKRPPRTLFISHNFNNEGAPNSLLELVIGLKQSNIVIPLVVGPTAGPLLAVYEAAGIETRVVSSLLKANKAKTSNEYFQACQECAKTLKMGDYDVVFANTVETHSVIQAAKISNIPSVWCIREGEMWNSYFRKFSKEIEDCALDAFQFPYRVVFVSQASRENWEALNSSKNFFTIKNGLDVERFNGRGGIASRETERRRLGVANDDIVILGVGGVIPRKGQHDLVMCLPMIPEGVMRRIQIFLVGMRHNQYSERIMDVVEGYPGWMRDRVTFVPETRNIIQYYKAADIFFCGSRIESYPRSILEAECSGLPLITTPVSGIPEQIFEDFNAFTYLPGRLNDLKENLLRLVRSQATREAMGQGSREMFKSLTSYEAMLDHYGRAIGEAAFSSVPDRIGSRLGGVRSD